MARPDLHTAVAFRSQAEIDAQDASGTGEGWIYDAARDAARGRVLQQSAISEADIRPYLRVPTTIDSGTAFYVWDLYFGPEWAGEPQERLPSDPFSWNDHHKAFQICSSRDPAQPNRQEVWFEQRTRYGSSPFVDFRQYHGGDSVVPDLTFPLAYDRWCRWFVRAIKQAGSSYQIDSWFADTQTDPVHILQNRTITGGPRLNGWWLEWDASGRRPAAPRGPTLAVWVRNLVVLHNPGDVTPLLVKPV